MDKMSDKEIAKAMNDTGYFKTLPLANMMDVLIQDIIANGDVKKKNFETWLEHKDRWDEITQEERMDEIIKVLEVDKPSKALRGMQKIGFTAFCLPQCFPIRKVMDKKAYYAIIDNFDKCNDDDVVVRLNLLMFPFDPKHTRKTFEDSNLDPDTIEWMMDTIENILDFLQVGHMKQLKRLICDYGLDFYYYINNYADNVFKMTASNDYRRQPTLEVVQGLLRRGDPLEIKDLDITKEDLKADGFETEEEQDAALMLLMDHCLNKPEDNIKVVLLKLADSYSDSKLQKTMKRPKKRRFV